MLGKCQTSLDFRSLNRTFADDMGQRIITFLKDWTLPIAMLVGAVGYFVYVNIPFLDGTHEFANETIAIVQPLLLFAILFLTFCKVEPRDLRLSAWQGWVLVFQTVTFIACALLIQQLDDPHWKGVVEGGMLCLICPTATAAAVVTRKLGGNAGTLMAYTIIINLAVAIMVPLVIPLIHPHPGETFLRNFMTIILRVFPLLLGPFFLSVVLRWFSRRTTERLAQSRDLPFYLWSVGLALAIAVTVKSIVHSHMPWGYQVAIAAVSLLTCIVQFAFGRLMGKRDQDPISAAQACGQKNTVFAIWMGYTFMTPVTSIAGGFYCIWHNAYNSWQMYRKKVKSEK